PEKQNLSYIRGILNGYQHRGGTTSQQAEKTDASFISPGKPKTPKGSGRNTSRSGKQQIPISVDDGSGDVPTPEKMAEMMQKAQEIKDAKASAKRFGGGRNESGKSKKPQIEICTPSHQPRTPEEISLQDEEFAKLLAEAEEYEKKQLVNQEQASLSIRKI
ncbi:hypothetical protein, partial [Paenibacillus sp. IHBB 3054]|uniref:hypothetical protein n=1 Tax=Paenibacillus sp. IHBB 3054 TaxID=3425689 RepID=UPI003F67B573